MKSKVLTMFLAFLVPGLMLTAQEPGTEKSPVNIGADLSTAYIWRGIELGNGPAIQPWGELSLKGFAFGTWGSYEIAGNFNEIDLYARYTLKSFSVSFVDLFFPGYEGLDQNYFNFKNSTTGHCSEVGLSFNGNEKFPLSIYGGIIVYGRAIDTNPDDPESINHSAYVELKYTISKGDYTFNIFSGMCTGKSLLYGTTRAGVCNLGASSQKTIKITDTFSVPFKVALTSNPVMKKAYLTVTASF